MESGDCSDRTCPFEIAWTDAPDKSGTFHHYAECANKGTCDRTTGEVHMMRGKEGGGVVPSCSATLKCLLVSGGLCIDTVLRKPS